MISLFALILVLVATIIGAIGSFFLKKGSNISIKKPMNKHLLLGIFFYGGSVIFYVIALKYDEISIIYPLTSLSYIWTSFLALKFLKEKMNALKWMGIALIIIGSVIIAQ